jgi:hypothetical protein
MKGRASNWPAAFLFAVIAPFAHPATVTPDQNSPSYQLGAKDRNSWEAWYHGLSGAQLDGASYWAAQRSQKPLIPCNSFPSNGSAWLTGCLEAKQRLSGPDRKRTSDPQYWNGWNGMGAPPQPTNNLSQGNATNAAERGPPDQPAPPFDDPTKQRSPPEADHTSSPVSAPNSSVTLPPGRVTIGISGVACPQLDDLFILYKSDMNGPEINAFMSKHGCEMVTAGISYALVEKGPFVSRILVNSDVMFARSIDLVK